MKKTKTDFILLWLSIAGFGVMSCSFLLMPLEQLEILPGVFFWGGLLLGVTFQIALEIRRRAFFKAYHVRRETMQKPRNGLMSFQSNTAAKVADIAFPCSLAATVLAFILTKGYGYICYVFITATVLAFCMHCILNGRIFFHVKNKNRVRQILEQKTKDLKKKERVK